MWKQTFQIREREEDPGGSDLPEGLYMANLPGAIAQRLKWTSNLYASFTANTPVGTPGTPITEGVTMRRRRRSSWQSYRRVTRSSSCDARRFRMAPDPRFSRIPDAGMPVYGRIVDGTTGRLKTSSCSSRQFVTEKRGARLLTTHNLSFAKDAIAW